MRACRDEVRELQEAAARMGASEALAPPPALRARILAAADQQPQLPPKVTPLEAARSRRWLPKIAAAAAAVVLLGGTAVELAQHRDGQSSVMASTVSQVFTAADARTKTVTTDHGRLTVAASPTMGRMAVDTDQPELSGQREGLPDVGRARRHRDLGRSRRRPEGGQGDGDAERRYDGRDHRRAQGRLGAADHPAVVTVDPETV